MHERPALRPASEITPQQLDGRRRRSVRKPSGGLIQQHAGSGARALPAVGSQSPRSGRRPWEAHRVRCVCGSLGRGARDQMAAAWHLLWERIDDGLRPMHFETPPNCSGHLPEDVRRKYKGLRCVGGRFTASTWFPCEIVRCSVGVICMTVEFKFLIGLSPPVKCYRQTCRV